GHEEGRREELGEEEKKPGGTRPHELPLELGRGRRRAPKRADAGSGRKAPSAVPRRPPSGREEGSRGKMRRRQPDPAHRGGRG
ncbi:unnamed protein product, partial [Urochloa humidicola]